MKKKIGNYYKQDQGFSLLELVVAVGVLLVLTAIGLLAYNGITNNARQASVSKAASEVYDAAMARYSGGEKGVPEDADDDWNNSASKDNTVKTEVRSLGNGRYEVKAWIGESYEASKYNAIKTTPAGNTDDEGGTGTTPPEETEDPGNGEEDLSFLDNPSILPERIVPVGNCSPETEREKSAIFLDESLRRGELFVKWYEGQVNSNGEADGEELYKWQTALSATFVDTDCGTFAMATEISSATTEAYYHFSIVVKPSGGGYYKAKEVMNEEEQERLDMVIEHFNLEAI